jgi:flagellar hook-associated protein 1 FlgK
MGFAQALSNAMSGLAATTRGTEIVATNIANVGTAGYSKRALATSANLTGGVGLHNVTRTVNSALTAELRAATSQMSDAKTRAQFLDSMQDLVGLPGEVGALTTVLADFKTKLLSAASRPDDEIRLTQVADAAVALATKLNSVSDAVQSARTEADTAIANDIATLNAQLETVATLNRKITVLEAQGADASSLKDERQLAVDRISVLVPVKSVERQNGQLALFTAAGAVLLDGTEPVSLSFSPKGLVTAEMQVSSGALGLLSQNGVPLSESQISLFAGGTLAARFAIRDELGPQFQMELDGLAYDLHQRLADPSTDATIAPDMPGLFTDQGNRATLANMTGLASRLSVNGAVLPAEGGDLWKMRSGMGAGDPSAAGNTVYLNAVIDALDAKSTVGNSSLFEGTASLETRFTGVESLVALRRVDAETNVTLTSSRTDALHTQVLALGVDSDAEMQMLLQYEQAYAANARVIQAIDEMISQILRW